MNKLLFFIFLTMVSGSVIGQAKRETPKRAELTEAHEAPQVKISPAAESEYFGFDAKIKDALLKESSIELVPKRIANETKEEYLKKLNLWIKNNSSLIKPDKKGVEIN